MMKLVLSLSQLSLCLAALKPLEKEALLKIYWSSGGANHSNETVTWFNYKNWGPYTDPCELSTRWHGVGCYDPCDLFRDGPDCIAGRITSVNLRANNMTGTIPTEIGDLLNTTLIDFSHNSLVGTIPTEFGSINNMQVLNLAHNYLTGTIPAELGNINGNFFPGHRMTELNLGWNSLSGAVPGNLKGLGELRYLDLSNNQLTGQIPDEWSSGLQNDGNIGLEDLQVLYLHRNMFTGTIPASVGYMGELAYLHMYWNAGQSGIGGPIPTSIGLLRKLNEFHAWNNTLTGSIPEEIGDMTNLRSLRMNQNKLSGPLPQSIGKLTNLYYLDTYENDMTGDVPAGIANLTHLQYLYIQNEHYRPLRQRYCNIRMPQVGKYSYKLVRDQYEDMMAMECPDLHSTEFTFNALPEDY